MRPMTAEPVTDLPAPDSPTTPSTSPLAMSKEIAVDGLQDAAAGDELDPQIADGEDGLGHRSLGFTMVSERVGRTGPQIPPF